MIQLCLRLGLFTGAYKANRKLLLSNLVEFTSFSKTLDSNHHQIYSIQLDTAMILTQFYLLFALFIGLCSCLSRSNYAQHPFRKRSRGSSRSLPIEDQKSIQAANLFFSNDKVTLGQAMEKYKVTDKSASSSSGKFT